MQAQNLKTGMFIKYGREKKKVKEVLYNCGMVQLTLESVFKRDRKPDVCMNVCLDFEFIILSEADAK